MDILTLYDENYQKVRKFILTLTRDEWVADDLIQETFIRVQKNMNTIKEKEKIVSWIFKVAYNLCMDHLKQRKKEPQTSAETEKVSIQIPLMRQIEQQQMGACIKDKMSRLPESMRIIIDLYDIMEFSHHEIAQILSISEENSKVKLHRARKKLKAILSKECSLTHDHRNVYVCEPVHPATEKTIKP